MSRSNLEQRSQILLRLRDSSRRQKEGETVAAGKSHGGFHSRGGWPRGASPILRGSERGGVSISLAAFPPRSLRRSRGHAASEKPEVAPGGWLSRIMRVERVEGATWKEAMPPLAPSDRSPTATPELNCSTIYPEVPPNHPRSQLSSAVVPGA